MEKIDESLYDVIKKKLAKLKKDYNDLKEKNSKLEVEKDFLNREIKKLKEKNLDLLSFQDKQKKIAHKIKKVLNKIESISL
ncbi:MAG: hypothetical protein IKN62_04330 [Elusimicrobia bacterium]|nr:hypothetical protein [Elusimicrobiota bacterium]